MLDRDDLIAIVGAAFMVEHNLKRPTADAGELLHRAFTSATLWVDYCEARRTPMEGPQR